MTLIFVSLAKPPPVELGHVMPTGQKKKVKKKASINISYEAYLYSKESGQNVGSRNATMNAGSHRNAIAT